MKIIIFAPYFYPHKGGLEQFLFQIAKGLSKKYLVYVITSKTDKKSNSLENLGKVKIYRLESWDLLGGTFPIIKPGKNNAEIWKKIKDIGADCVITNTRFFYLSFLGQRFAKKNSIKSIHIEHGTSHPQLKNPFAKLIAQTYDHTLGRMTFQLADKVLAVSRSAATFTKSLGLKGKIEIIHNAIDGEFFKPNPRIMRKKQIIFTGRIIEGKGIQDLIMAINLMEEKVDLKIIGKGNYLAFLKTRYRSKNIHFLGEKDPKEIKKLLNESSVFVNPSYSEGLPSSVLEAGAMECAVIATDVGGTSEIITDNIDGYLVPPKNPQVLAKKIDILLNNKQRMVKFGQRLRKKIIQGFSWGDSTAKLIQIIENETSSKN